MRQPKLLRPDEKSIKYIWLFEQCRTEEERGERKNEIKTDLHLITVSVFPTTVNRSNIMNRTNKEKRKKNHLRFNVNAFDFGI